jgi:Xaa-Pro dipeptidase
MLSQRNQKQIQAKLQAQMAKEGYDALILSSPDAIFYSTGYASSFLFATQIAGYCWALIPAEGPCEVILMEMERQTAVAQLKDVVIRTFPTWIYIDDEGMDKGEKPAQPDLDRPFDIFADVVRRKYPNAKVGMEIDSLAYPRCAHAMQVFGANLSDCTPLLRKVRATKTPWEIEVLRRAAKSCERAMFETAGYVRAGWTQAQVFRAFREAAFRQDPEIDACSIIPSIGKRYSTMELPLEDVVLESGDIVRLDPGPSINKYNSDLSRTFVLGDPRPGQVELFEILKKGNKRAMQLIGPGVRMCDVFNEVLKTMRGCGLNDYIRGHFGHSVGCMKFVEEYPFISPNNTAVFEPGMVFCVETPYYSGKLGGFNIEDEILITENGYERWTVANEDLYWGRKY